MSENFIKGVRKQVEDAEKRLVEAKELISRLQTAGEDTTDLQSQATALEYKIQRYKQAFKE
jgi:hypothetical protein